jgi:hypothetical protein
MNGLMDWTERESLALLVGSVATWWSRSAGWESLTGEQENKIEDFGWDWKRGYGLVGSDGIVGVFDKLLLG